MGAILQAGCVVLAMTLIYARPGAAAPASKTTTFGELPYYNWSGAYVGGTFGWSGGDARSTLSDPNLTETANSYGSLYGGLHAGYNVLIPSRILLGVEADISFPNFLEGDAIATGQRTGRGSVVTDRLDFVSTARGRLGYAFDHWMAYTTAGFAWSQARLTESPGARGDDDILRRQPLGWSLGAGAETAFARDWTARLEYLYDDFGHVTGVFATGTRFDTRINEHTLRLGLNRRFGIGDTQADSGTSGPAAESQNWNIHGQLTFVQQGYPTFRSPYEGPNSLQGEHQAANTISATAFMGWRPWAGTEIYFNPELMQGFGLSDVHGVAAYPNGEAQKSNFPAPRVNAARLFVRQTIGLGGEQENVEDGPNQLPGKQDISRITLIAGKLAVTDFFDGNSYAHDPRTTFLNWNMYCCGSYDWTMDKISYTWGALAELNQKFWAIRVGYFLVPVVSNDNRYDAHLLERGEYIAELELRYSLFSQPGRLRLMPWINVANAGSYSEAVGLPINSSDYPDITPTRRVRANYGFVVNMEQALSNDVGLFSRVSWNAGKTEMIGWTDCDESLSVGVVLKGTSWGRADDRIGAGAVLEGLSTEARAYFSAGGLGIMIGDGRLNYRPEKAFETYYAYSFSKSVAVTADYQFIVDPGYNADRGPVSVFSARLHAEF